MLILLNKVILHILDFNSGVMVFSEQELERTDTVEIFLQKQNVTNYLTCTIARRKVSGYIKNAHRSNLYYLHLSDCFEM